MGAKWGKEEVEQIMAEMEEKGDFESKLEIQKSIRMVTRHGPEEKVEEWLKV